jgi:hypothetical protein
MAATHIADLSIDEFKILIKETVLNVLRNSGKEPAFKETQSKYLIIDEANSKTLTPERIVAELALEWLSPNINAPTSAETPSFLKTARNLNLQGPADWSERLEDYLYAETPNG